MPDPKQSALENPRSNDRWLRAGKYGRRVSTVDRRMKVVVFIRETAGRRRQVVHEPLDVFQRWCRHESAAYLGNADERSADGQ